MSGLDAGAGLPGLVPAVLDTRAIGSNEDSFMIQA